MNWLQQNLIKIKINRKNKYTYLKFPCPKGNEVIQYYHSTSKVCHWKSPVSTATWISWFFWLRRVFRIDLWKSFVSTVTWFASSFLLRRAFHTGLWESPVSTATSFAPFFWLRQAFRTGLWESPVSTASTATWFASFFSLQRAFHTGLWGLLFQQQLGLHHPFDYDELSVQVCESLLF